MKKSHFYSDETASETMAKVERKRLWASTKRDSDPTAQQSLEGLARRAGSHLLDENAGVRAWTSALCPKLPSTKRLVALITDSGVDPLKKWLQGFSEFIRPKIREDPS